MKQETLGQFETWDGNNSTFCFQSENHPGLAISGRFAKSF